MADDRYKLADDPPPPRPRAVSLSREPDDSPSRSEPIDLFPFLLGGVVLVWVGLGLAARGRPPVALVLVVAGGVVVALGQLYLLWTICQDNPRDAFWSALFDWYASIWSHLNPDLVWRPFLISGCGLLMMVTGWATGARWR